MLYALADQTLHGADVPTAGHSSQVLADLQDRFGAVPHVKGTHMQARNHHLVGYGGTYYGYTYTRCLAAETWHQHLSSDPFSPQAGATRLHASIHSYIGYCGVAGGSVSRDPSHPDHV